MKLPNRWGEKMKKYQTTASSEQETIRLVITDLFSKKTIDYFTPHNIYHIKKEAKETIKELLDIDVELTIIIDEEHFTVKVKKNE